MKTRKVESTKFMDSTKKIMTQAVLGNTLLWQSMFWHTWNNLRLDEKLTWIVFVGQTIAVITLLEFILFKK